VQAFGVFDGHGGFLAADIAASQLLDMILADLATQSLDTLTADAVARIIDASFIKCDQMIIEEALRLKNARDEKAKLEGVAQAAAQAAATASSADIATSSQALHVPATSGAGGGVSGGGGIGTPRAFFTAPVKPHGRAGCCALVVVIIGATMFFAHTGDCRAVICRAVGGPSSSSSPHRQKSGGTGGGGSSGKVGSESGGGGGGGVSARRDEVSEVDASSSSSSSSSAAKRVCTDPTTIDLSSDETSSAGTDSPKETCSPTLSASPVALAMDSFMKFDFALRNSQLLKETNVPASPHCSSGSSSNSSCSSSSSKGGSSRQHGTESSSSERGGDSSFITRDFFLEAMGAIQNSEVSTSAGKKRPRQAAQTKEVFEHCASGLEVASVTTDHSCVLTSEIQAISKMTSDPNPFRPSESDKRASGSMAPLRVAGSLAVTRALGDGYLKLKELSIEPYIPHLPYITCQPTISWRTISPLDRSLVLASDGLWNFVTAKEVHSVLKWQDDHHVDFLKADLSVHHNFNSHEPSSEDLDGGHVPVKRESIGETVYSKDAASMLLDRCILNAAAYAGKSETELRSMQPGTSRRDFLDDVTVMVLLFEK